MRANEIGAQLASELKNRYLYRQGKWLYRESKGWGYATVPRLAIWKAMVERKRDGVVPSKALADDIQYYLETYLLNP